MEEYIFIDEETLTEEELLLIHELYEEETDGQTKE